MANKVLKDVLITFDSSGNPAFITIDGRDYTGFASASNYGTSKSLASSSVPVQIEIDAGDYSKSNITLPAYTVFHHKDGRRISVSSHS